MKRIDLHGGAAVNWIFRAGDAQYKCYLSVSCESEGGYIVNYSVYPTGTIAMIEGSRHVVRSRDHFDDAEAAYDYCKSLLHRDGCPAEQQHSFFERWST